MVCASVCCFSALNPKTTATTTATKLSFCILAKFAVAVVDFDVDFDSHSTAKVSNFAFSAQYNKRSNSNNNNNNVVDNVVQQFGQNIVSISDTANGSCRSFERSLGP